MLLLIADWVYFLLDLATGALRNSAFPVESGSPLVLLMPAWAFIAAREGVGR